MQNIMRRIAVVGVISLSSGWSAFADVVTFPAEGGVYDLSSAAAWGGTLPATTDTIQLNQTYGKVLTFSGSCTFDTLLFKGNSTANTIEIADPEVVVRLSGTENAEPGIRTVTKTTSAALTLRGGTYDLNGKGVLTASAATVNNESNSGCSLTLDGVTVSNAASIAVANARSPGSCKMVLTNGTHVLAAAADKFMRGSGSWGSATGIVAGGSKLTITGGSFNPFQNYVQDALLLVTGEGSVISNASAYADHLFYNSPKRCVIRVEKGGELNARSVQVCYAGGVSNVIEVASGGLVRFHDGDVLMPYSKTCAGTALKVLEDGSFLSTGTLTLQQADNLILVSNGTFDAELQISGTRNAVRVLGPKAKYRPHLSRIFSANSKNCLLEFGDGATWSVSYPYLSATGAASNTLSIVRNATVNFGAFNGISYNDNSVSGYAIRVADGGNLVCKAPEGHSNWKDYRMTGYDNVTVVSNGTLDIEGDLLFGDSNTATEKDMADTRNSLVFQGRMPLATVGGDAALSRGTRIRFEVPKDGYPDKAVLWTAARLYRSAGDPIRLEVTGLDADYVQGLESPFDVTLIKTTGSSASYTVATALGAQIEALAQTMPARVRLYISKDGKELHLSAKPVRGTVLVVR